MVAGCAVDNTEAAVADLAAAAQNVVGICQSAVAAEVIKGGIYTSKRYDAPTREGGIAGEEDARVGRGRESAVVNERVLKISGVVTPVVTVDPAAMVTSRIVPALRARVPVDPVLSSVPPTSLLKRMVTLEPFSERIVALLVKTPAEDPSKVRVPPPCAASDRVSKGAASVEEKCLARNVCLDDARRPLMTLRLL